MKFKEMQDLMAFVVWQNQKNQEKTSHELRKNFEKYKIKLEDDLKDLQDMSRVREELIKAQNALLDLYQNNYIPIFYRRLNLYGVCSNCQRLVKLNKWLFGSLHYCPK